MVSVNLYEIHQPLIIVATMVSHVMSFFIVALLMVIIWLWPIIPINGLLTIVPIITIVPINSGIINLL
jgi:hypothetical protein